MSNIKQQMRTLTEDVKLGLPYVSLGLVGLAPIEVSSWSLLGGVVALSYLTQTVKNYFELSPRNKMRKLNRLCDHMSLTENGYEMDEEDAQEVNIPAQTPFTLSSDEREKTSMAIRAMYLDKTAYYNISKNLKPMQAAYRALNDVWKECQIDSDIYKCFRTGDQEKMITLYELATLYNEVRQYETDEGILMHHNAVHEDLYNEESFNYDAVGSHLKETDYLINQSTHSLPVRKQLRGLLLGTIGLTALAAGMTANGLVQDGIVPERVRYVVGMAGILMGAGYLRGKRFIDEETARFNNDEFIADVIEYQTTRETPEATVFSSTVTRMQDGEKIRRELSFYQAYTTRLGFNMNAEVKAIEQNAHNDIKKFTMYQLFQKGYNIEDGMRFYGIDKVSEEMVGMCAARHITEDTICNYSTQEHYNHMKEIANCLAETVLEEQEDERKNNIPPEQQVYLKTNIEDIPYSSIEREVIVPKGLKVHPRVRELFTQYQNQ